MTVPKLDFTELDKVVAAHVPEYDFDQLHVAEDHETYCDVCGFSYSNEDPCTFH